MLTACAFVRNVASYSGLLYITSIDVTIIKRLYIFFGIWLIKYLNPSVFILILSTKC